MPRPYHERLNFTMTLPLRVISHGTCGPKMVLPHWHQAIELAYAYKGHPGTVHIGGSTYHMEEEHLYVVNSEVVHSYETFLDETNQIITLLLPQAWLFQVVAAKQLPFWGPLDLDLRSAPYLDLARSVHTLATNALTEPDDRADYLASLGAEYQLVGELLKRLTVNGQVSSDQLPLPQPLRQAVTEIQDNYGQPVSIADMAERLNYSSVYFSRYFKEYMGISPKAYLGQIRLERATQLLMTSKTSIQEIALQTGFRTEKNFFVTFKRHYQMTPKTYREKYAAEQSWT
ncbi:MAG: AraC family transcriptional regulator [Levilactobacillus sp.]|uniref:AraC family transcriptional regulator n=1 Tax=Levilactobacillus sp. TaxID=2767919 RepID=UPI00258783B3|nr:AraC family transcriptional regulator [Levilactobacillus sp.]MCH4124345.1 AraC family transcriptional regulator [Levilactobacillus sp.]MCI1553295.1 AraC family transcriptional regulator [Levilactobacillus sp.]MCI1598538.1 AraC family transcriptional regulator [Levilactobacillus sp.]MCI1605212.1 AraC family transcriptional regulator [Levilactobacillus sp.]